MNYDDESYVRLYTRDTATWLRLRFAGQTVLMHLLRKLDRAGVLDGVVDPVDDIELLTGIPRTIVKDGVARLLKLGVIEHTDNRLIVPRFIDAQTAMKTDVVRTREMRARRRDYARKMVKDTEVVSRGVTKSHGPSQPVTERHGPPRGVTPSLASPSSTEQIPSERSQKRLAQLVGEVGMRLKFAASWKPDRSHVERARELGIPPARFDELAQHAKLRDYPRGFTSEDDTFMRQLLFERSDQEQKNYARRQK